MPNQGRLLGGNVREVEDALGGGAGVGGQRSWWALGGGGGIRVAHYKQVAAAVQGQPTAVATSVTATAAAHCVAVITAVRG